ncbi:hypothetical protein D3C85_1385930 [compost metagenome]
MRPAKEAVTLFIALEFDVHIIFKRFRAAESVNHYGVVDNQIDRNKRIDLFRVSAGFLNGIAHCRKVNNYGNASEILQDDTCWNERDFFVFATISPSSKLLDVLFRNCAAVELTNSSFEQNLDGEWELGNVTYALLFQSLQTVVSEWLSADFQRSANGVFVLMSHSD